MLEVTVVRKVTEPHYQIFYNRVILSGFKKLTPKAAIVATELAHGSRGGEVMQKYYNLEEQCWERITYKVTAKSVRKICHS